MLTNNNIYPQCYAVSKIEDLAPQGIIKVTAKMDEFDPNKDNVELQICNYYDGSGDVYIEKPIFDSHKDELKYSSLYWTKLDENEELIKDEEPEEEVLHIGETSYFIAEFSHDDVISDWRIEFDPQTEDEENYTDQEIDRLIHFLVLDKLDETTISIRPSKAKSLIGKKFTLIVQNKKGEYKSQLGLEVVR